MSYVSGMVAADGRVQPPQPWARSWKPHRSAKSNPSAEQPRASPQPLARGKRNRIAPVIIIGAGNHRHRCSLLFRRRQHPVPECSSATATWADVWNTHKWHGARCDSDIIKYSFSFKPLLSDTCLLDSDRIQDYLRSVAGEFGIPRNIRFDTRVNKAVFDSRHNRWFVHTNRGIFTLAVPVQRQRILRGQALCSIDPGQRKFRRGEIISHLPPRRQT